MLGRLEQGVLCHPMLYAVLFRSQSNCMAMKEGRENPQIPHPGGDRAGESHAPVEASRSILEAERKKERREEEKKERKGRKDLSHQNEGEKHK